MTNRVKLIARYGDPVEDRIAFENKSMVVWKPRTLFPWFPAKRIYVNRDIISPLVNTLTLLEAADLHLEIKEFSGCFNVRCIRGYENPCIQSIHSWAMAIDFNAADNPLGVSRESAIERGLTPFTEAFQQVWRDSGWVCGVDFGRRDGMHWQWTKEFA